MGRLALACGLGAAPLSAQELPEYSCSRAAPPPVIDGRGDDPAWRQAEAVRLVDVRVLSGREFERATQVRLAWDDEALYLLFTAFDPDVWSTLGRRDDPLYDEEVVEVFIDPDGDGLDYAEIEVNPVNTVFDLLVTKALREGGQGLPAWSPAGLRTAVHVEGTANAPGDVDQGWSTEIRLPWAALAEGPLDVAGESALPPRVGDRWRINLYRYERLRDQAGRETGTVEYSAWSPVGRVDFHVPERFGVLAFAGGATAAVPASWAQVKMAIEALGQPATPKATAAPLAALGRPATPEATAAPLAALGQPATPEATAAPLAGAAR